MRCGGWIVGMVAGGSCLFVVGGCVTLDEHTRMKAAHRSVLASKEALMQEITDLRSGNESLSSRAGSLERELETKTELLANLRKENELLDEMRRTAQAALNDMADNQVLGSISITGPKLPAQLDNALKRFANEYPSSVVYDSTRGTVRWKSDLLFAAGSDVVKESSQEALRGFSQIIGSSVAADFEVIVVGHTDGQPIKKSKSKHPTNWHLSVHRSIAVAIVLSKNGYAPERMGIMGMGEYRPVADNATKVGASKNRRVEVFLVPKGALLQTSAGPDWPTNGRVLAFASLTPSR